MRTEAGTSKSILRRAQEGLDAAVDEPALMQTVEDVALVQLDHEGLAAAETRDGLRIERLGGDHVVAHDLGAGPGLHGHRAGIAVGAQHHAPGAHAAAARKADDGARRGILDGLHRHLLADARAQRRRAGSKRAHQPVGVDRIGGQLERRLAAAVGVGGEIVPDLHALQQPGQSAERARP